MSIRESISNKRKDYYLLSRKILEGMDREPQYRFVDVKKLSQHDLVLHSIAKNINSAIRELVETFGFSEAANSIANSIENKKMKDHWIYIIRNREARTLISRISSIFDYFAILINEVLYHHNNSLHIKNIRSVDFKKISRHLKRIDAETENLKFDIKKSEKIISLLSSHTERFIELRNIDTHRYPISIDEIGFIANRADGKLSGNRNSSYRIQIGEEKIEYYTNYEISYSQLSGTTEKMIYKMDCAFKAMSEMHAMRKVIRKII